jgi:thiamine-monophosphate kinase
MKVWELGEFGLIELIARTVGKAKRRDLILGIGDDTAAWRTDKSIQLGTTDILIQNVHFTLDIATWRELGWKALAVNISDIAAMGGTPSFAMVSLGLPPETEVDNIVDLCRGMKEIASKFDVDIVGGNISRAPVVIIDVSLIGKASGTLLTRSEAAPGDQIAVTGYLGLSAAGLKILKAKRKLDSKTTAFFREAHLRPRPRVTEGQALAQHGVKTAIDLSDGLLGDLKHICKASNVGARVWINKLPIHPLLKSTFKKESRGLALSGGEDYELLFTARSKIIVKLRNIMSIPVTVIGEIAADKQGQVTLLDEHGKAVKWDETGWDHFKSPGLTKQ